MLPFLAVRSENSRVFRAYADEIPRLLCIASGERERERKQGNDPRVYWFVLYEGSRCEWAHILPVCNWVQ